MDSVAHPPEASCTVLVTGAADSGADDWAGAAAAGLATPTAAVSAAVPSRAARTERIFTTVSPRRWGSVLSGRGFDRRGRRPDARAACDSAHTVVPGISCFRVSVSR